MGTLIINTGKAMLLGLRKEIEKAYDEKIIIVSFLEYLSTQQLLTPVDSGDNEYKEYYEYFQPLSYINYILDLLDRYDVVVAPIGKDEIPAVTCHTEHKFVVLLPTKESCIKYGFDKEYFNDYAISAGIPVLSMDHYSSLMEYLYIDTEDGKLKCRTTDIIYNDGEVSMTVEHEST